MRITVHNDSVGIRLDFLPVEPEGNRLSESSASYQLKAHQEWQFFQWRILTMSWGVGWGAVVIYLLFSPFCHFLVFTKNKGWGGPPDLSPRSATGFLH